MRFTPFGELLTKGLFKSLVYTINPTACCLSLLFYNCCLRLCSLTLSFKTAFWCSNLICWSFCSREYGCNNMEATSRCAAMLFSLVCSV